MNKSESVGMAQQYCEFIMLKLPSLDVFSSVHTFSFIWKSKKKNSINLCKKIETSIATIDVFWTKK